MILSPQQLTPEKVLDGLIAQIKPVDFLQKSGLNTGKEKLKQKHYRITAVEEILTAARSNNWDICINNGFTYLYNGNYWPLLEGTDVEKFLGKAAHKLGIDKFDAADYEFQAKLHKQFLHDCTLTKPKPSTDITLINLLNGTYEIGLNKQGLRPPRREDFITYQLPFNYDPIATCPLFMQYLEVVQPDISRQHILAEFLAYLFIKPAALKLEKALLLYGTGANGKSVFFEIVSAMLGGNINMSNYSLQSLTNESGYQRAMLANKLVNYASEINGKLESATFKQLVSGEPVEARLPYGNPFMLADYAKLIFNCNELPKDVEHTNAYFRRFLIVPFDITVPPEKQDKELPKKIIESELSGVFNWVLQGLERLLRQKNFTYSVAVEQQLNQYKKQSDSMQLFLEDEGYKSDLEVTMQLKELFACYRIYCRDNGYFPASNKTFVDRLRAAGFETKRQNTGNIVFIKKDFL